MQEFKSLVDAQGHFWLNMGYKGNFFNNENFFRIYFQVLEENILIRLHDRKALNSHIYISLFLYIFYIFSYLLILQN